MIDPVPGPVPGRTDHKSSGRQKVAAGAAFRVARNDGEEMP